MTRLGPQDLVDLASYARLRDEYRRAVIAYKRTRRMSVGEKVTLLFEDRETLRFQVLEMLHVERIADPVKVRHELDVYNELLPGSGELSASLFVEITEPGRIREELDRLIGIDERVTLELGDEAEAGAVRAAFDPKQLQEDRLSAVQYIRFALDAEQIARFCDGSLSAWIRIDHPHYQRREIVPPSVRTSLAAGLRADPPALLDVDAVRVSTAPERVLFETDHVRAFEPAGAHPAEHTVLELRAGAALEDRELWVELLDAVRRAARNAIATRGSCRIEADLGKGAITRFHVIARAPTSER